MKRYKFVVQHFLTVLVIAFQCSPNTVVNGNLLKDRAVQCNSNEMVVSLEFVQTFTGVVYANKYYQAKGCKWEGDGSRRMQIPIPLNANPATQPYCGVQLKEATGEFTATLVVSPMKGLLIDGMEGLTVRCLYTIADVTLTLPAGTNGAGIFISPQTQAGVVTGSGGSPFLQMTIRDGHGINGDIIQSALVGQRLTLDVVMGDTTIYDFYVHDCYAHDGTNTPDASINIVDNNGCAVRLSRAVDVPVFTTAPVPNGAKHVYVHMYGFQFTTSQLVYFECQVRPCLQTCNRAQCLVSSSTTTTTTRTTQRVTNASASTKPRRVRRASTKSTADAYADNYNLTTVIRIEAQELGAAPSPTDGNAIVEAAIASGDLFGNQQTSATDICLNINVAVGILTIFIVVCIVSLIVAVFLCRRVQRRNVSKESTNSSKSGEQSRDSVTSYDALSTASLTGSLCTKSVLEICTSRNSNPATGRSVFQRAVQGKLRL